jgi:hypothetical protein
MGLFPVRRTLLIEKLFFPICASLDAAEDRA